MATTKIKRAVAEIGVNGGNISKAMRTVGYAPSTAARTDKLVRRKGFQQLMEKILPDNLLLRVHREGLEATKLHGPGAMALTGDGGLSHADTEVPDYPTRHKYLETGYKVKGKMKEVENPPPVPTQTLIIIQTPNGDTTVGIQAKS